MSSPLSGRFWVIAMAAWLSIYTGNAYSAAEDNFGHFEGEVCTNWNDKDNRSMTLCAPFSFVDPENMHWDVPAGTVVDGASIPQAFWSFIGGPFEGAYRKASVVHDYYCEVHTRPWQAVHRMFYYGMLAGGTPATKAKVMYYAVLVGGPRWKTVLYTNHEPRAFPKPGDVDETKVVPFAVEFDQRKTEEDAKWIEHNNPSLEDIEMRAKQASRSIDEPRDRVRTDRK